jgi:hypothetical protein
LLTGFTTAISQRGVEGLFASGVVGFCSSALTHHGSIISAIASTRVRPADGCDDVIFPSWLADAAAGGVTTAADGYLQRLFAAFAARRCTALGLFRIMLRQCIATALRQIVLVIIQTGTSSAELHAFAQLLEVGLAGSAGSASTSRCGSVLCLDGDAEQADYGDW